MLLPWQLKGQSHGDLQQTAQGQQRPRRLQTARPAHVSSEERKPGHVRPLSAAATRERRVSSEGLQTTGEDEFDKFLGITNDSAPDFDTEISIHQARTSGRVMFTSNLDQVEGAPSVSLTRRPPRPHSAVDRMAPLHQKQQLQP